MKKWKIVIADNNNNNFPSSEGLYTDIVDFPNETNTGQDLAKRDEYVKEFFFLDLENDIVNAPLRENPKESENEGSFSISIKNSKFSFDELLMKNYACLVTFDNEGVEKKREYIHIFLTSFTKGEEGMVTYSYIVDLPMTYPQEYKTKEGVDSFIERSHTKNYDFLTGNYIYEGANILTEENFDDLEPGYLDSVKIPVMLDWNSLGGLTEEGVKRMEEIVWVMIFKKPQSGEEPSKIFLKSKKDDLDFTSLACVIYIAPIQRGVFITGGGRFDVWGSWEKLRGFQKDVNVLSIQPLDNFLLNFSKYFLDVIYIESQNNLEFELLESEDSFWDAEKGALKLVNIYDVNTQDIPFQKIPIPDKPVLTFFNQPAQIKNEVKLFTSTHRSYQIINVNAEPVSFSPEWIKKDVNNEIEIFPFFSYSPDKTTLAYMIEETNNDNFLTKKGSVSSEVIELQQTEAPVDNFFVKNKTSFITGMVTGTVGLGVPAIREGRRIGRNRGRKNAKILSGIFRDVLKLGKSDGMDITQAAEGLKIHNNSWIKTPTNRTSAGAISAIAAYKFANSIANVGDLANQPSQSKNTLNSVVYYLQVPHKLLGETVFTTLRNNDSELQIAFKYYQAMGHNYSNFGDFNKLKLGNYHVNYLQTTNLFQNLDNNLSAKLNSIISNNFSEGVRVWHYRDEESWCGINNFEFENMNMEMLEKIILYNKINQKITTNSLIPNWEYGLFNASSSTEIIHNPFNGEEVVINGLSTIKLLVTQELLDFLEDSLEIVLRYKLNVKALSGTVMNIDIKTYTNNSLTTIKPIILNPDENVLLENEITMLKSDLIIGEYIYSVIISKDSGSINFSPNNEDNVTLIYKK